MVKRVFGILHKEISGLHEAAYLLGFFTILSQVLGLVRDRLFASYFGAGLTLDLYYSAFRIPDFIFITVASIVSVSVLVPYFVDKIDKEKDESRKFIDSIFTLFFLLIVSVSLVAYFLIPKLTAIVFPGFLGESRESLIDITRIMLLSPIFLGISNFLASIIQAYRRFFIYALSPLLYNAGIIFGTIFLYPRFGINGLAFGVVIGAIMHLCIQVPFIMRKNMMPRFRLITPFSDLKNIIITSLSRTLALSVNNIALMFLIAMASLMAVGSISVFNLAWNIQSVPLSIFGVSYTVAIFPSISRLFSNGEKSKFVDEIKIVASHIIFWSVPAAVLFIVLRAQIVRVILGSGEFDWSDTRLTAAALAIFSVSVLAQSLYLLFVRGYYASGNSSKPLLINVFSSICIVIFSFGLIKIFNSHELFRFFIEHLFRVDYLAGTEILMLPLGFAIATIMNVVFLWFFFSREFVGFSKYALRVLYQSLSASIVMGFVTYTALGIFGEYFDLNTFTGVFLQGLISGLIGIVLLILTLTALRSRELVVMWNTLHRKIWKADIILPEQEGL